MSLIFRPAHPDDFPQCFGLLQERFLFENQRSRLELFDFWEKILKDPFVMSTIVEDDGKPKEKNIVGFCISFFTTENFAREARTTLPPFLPLQVLRRWKRGRGANPFLNRKAIAHDNAHDGLNHMVLHYAVEPRKFFLLEAPVHLKLFDGFRLLYGGFQLSQTLQECYDSRRMDMLLQAGCVIRRDYAEAMDQSPLVRDVRPLLTGLDREEAMNKANLASQAFVFSPPRFGFSQGEQDVLEKALGSALDRDIAPALGLTIWAIKKRWQGIYEKVENADPSILDPKGNKKDEEDQKTRRKFLLDYLRTHLEELRPYSPGRRSQSKKTAKL